MVKNTSKLQISNKCLFLLETPIFVELFVSKCPLPNNNFWNAWALPILSKKQFSQKLEFYFALERVGVYIPNWNLGWAFVPGQCRVSGPGPYTKLKSHSPRSLYWLKSYTKIPTFREKNPAQSVPLSRDSMGRESRTVPEFNLNHFPDCSICRGTVPRDERDRNKKSRDYIVPSIAHPWKKLLKQFLLAFLENPCLQNFKSS